MLAVQNSAGKNRCLRRGIALLLVLFSSHVLALDPHKSLTQYGHDSWQTRDGLPANTINSILQTRDGYLWLGTQAGLVRFNGTQFTIFDKDNTPGLKSNAILKLYESRAGELWIGTYGGGLSRYQDGRFTAYTASEGLPNNFIWALAEDQQGALWIGTGGGGLSRFKDDHFRQYTVRDGLAADYVRALRMDGRGRLWIGTGNGLDYFQEEGFTHAGLRGHLVNSLYEDRAGRLWAGTGRGVQIWQAGKFKPFLPDEVRSEVRALCEDRAGNLWIGTHGAGLYRWDGRQVNRLTEREKLSNNRVLDIYEDREGSLWVGTRGGQDRFKDGKLTVFSTQQGLPDDLTMTVYEDRNGRICIGMESGGLSCLENGVFRNYGAHDGLPRSPVRALVEDAHGRLWVGTENGLAVRHVGGFKVLNVRDGLPSSAILALQPARDGGLWVGTNQGLSYLKDGRFRNYDQSHGMTSDAVRVLLEDRAGNLWIGTRGGLMKFSAGRFTPYGTNVRLAEGVIAALYEDGGGTLWVGTGNSGLYRLRADRVTAFTTKNGLHYDSVLSILEDDQQRLWMSSPKGVFYAEKPQLNALADGKIQAITTVAYGVSDGMKSSVCAGGSQPVGWKARDGNLWFATVNGVVKLDPRQLRLNELPPLVVIERVSSGAQPVALGASATLPPERSDLELHFAGLSFLAPEKVLFKYKLEGYDADWVEAGTRRLAQYTNLPPGPYRFRVRASNNDGRWSADEASFSFYRQPHFYQTWWFYGACAGLLSALLWQGHRQRVRRVQAQFAAVLDERTRIARELHDTLEQGLTAIQIQLEAIAAQSAETAPRLRQYLETTRQMARHSLLEVRNAVLDLRARALEEGDLAHALAQIGVQTTAHTSIRFQLETQGAPQRLPGLLENNLLRIGQEAITNAVRHAHAREIKLTLQYLADEIRLKVKDDGCGFAAAEALAGNFGQHFGLLGMRERANKIGAKLEVNSVPGAGTEIALVAQFNR